MRQMLVTEMDGRRQTLVASKCLSGGRETTAVTVASLKMPPDEIGWDGMGSASPEVFYNWGSLTNLVLINPSVINDEEYKVAERERHIHNF